MLKYLLSAHIISADNEQTRTCTMMIKLPCLALLKTNDGQSLAAIVQTLAYGPGPQ